MVPLLPQQRMPQPSAERPRQAGDLQAWRHSRASFFDVLEMSAKKRGLKIALGP